MITIDEGRFENYRRRPEFIQKYIFPGGMLPTPLIIEREATKAGLQFVSGEFFGEGYARTLEVWKRRFQDAWPAIKALESLTDRILTQMSQDLEHARKLSSSAETRSRRQWCTKRFELSSATSATLG